MLTPEVVANYRVINHECEHDADLVPFGTTRTGAPALINRHCAHADVRIITGFIEPHFFAGFSGGPKGIAPGVAGLQTVMSNHGAHNIGDPRAAFGITDGNPLWEELRDIALRVGPSFLLNVTLNETKQITNVFAGDMQAAHKTGYEYVRKSAMQRVKDPFDIVVTTNSGYPLDMNLYQGVKGMSAAARIVRPGGLIILACECSEGAREQPARQAAAQRAQFRGNPADAGHARLREARAVAGADSGAHPAQGRGARLQQALRRNAFLRAPQALPRHRRGSRGAVDEARPRSPHRRFAAGAVDNSLPRLSRRQG
jgi:hypothetical protein